jgi:hypothetical protein
MKRRPAVKYKANISGLKLLEHYLDMDIKKVKWYISRGRGRQLLRITRLLYLRYIRERNRYVEKMSGLAEETPAQENRFVLRKGKRGKA